MIRPLSRPYACKWGVPVVDRVDPAIFTKRYFMRCMECSYCFDSCCQYGADVNVENVARLRAAAPELERFTGVPQDRWFTEEYTDDPEQPGGRITRTRIEGGGCVFRSKVGRTPQGGPAAIATVHRTPQGGPAANATVVRGCMIHSYDAQRGADYHDLKPMVCVLFPVTFDWGLLHPSNEIQDRSLQCIDDGPTLYQGVRDEIAWYFGADLVEELDAFEREAVAEAELAKTWTPE